MRDLARAGAALLLLVTGAGLLQAQERTETRPMGITDVPGLRVGHHTLAARPTGCTVVLVPDGAVAGVDVRGGAPGTREIALLDPVETVQEVQAIVLSGGSAFGLDAASGTVRWLEEHGLGYAVGDLRVPIVPAAILFDLGIGGDPTVRPGPECGYAAAEAATEGPVEEGSVGAGAGATVGKLAGLSRAMKGGIGTASRRLPDGTVVAAIIAVNALGDVVDPATGEVVAGARTPDGRGLADARRILRGASGADENPGGNTVIGVVATDATLSKAQATKMAQMAQDGLARAVYPSHTPWDGDTIFGLATGGRPAPDDLLVLGALAADAVSEAILRAVRAADGLEGYPSVRDLAAGR